MPYSKGIFVFKKCNVINTGDIALQYLYSKKWCTFKAAPWEAPKVTPSTPRPHMQNVHYANVSTVVMNVLLQLPLICILCKLLLYDQFEKASIVFIDLQNISLYI